MTAPAEVLDAQVHVWEADHAGRPWSTVPPVPTAEPSPFYGGTSIVTDDEMVAMMDEVGVSGAILVSSTRHYGTDNSYSLEAAARRPERFRVVVRLDPASPRLRAEAAAAAADPLVVGVRVLTMTEPDRARFRADGFDDLFAAAQEAGIPLCIYPTETLALVARAARSFPELTIVVDHLGLTQRPVAARGDDVWGPLPDLLALARYPNVAVKLSGIPALSWQPFPYADVWPNVHRVLAAFGPERVMWGSDCTRTEGVLTYAEGLRWLTEGAELSDDALAPLLGGTLRRVLGWPASAG